MLLFPDHSYYTVCTIRRRPNDIDIYEETDTYTNTGIGEKCLPLYNLGYVWDNTSTYNGPSYAVRLYESTVSGNLRINHIPISYINPYKFMCYGFDNNLNKVAYSKNHGLTVYDWGS